MLLIAAVASSILEVLTTPSLGPRLYSPTGSYPVPLVCGYFPTSTAILTSPQQWFQRMNTENVVLANRRPALRSGLGASSGYSWSLQR